MRCKSCSKEFTNDEDAIMHKVMTHGDVTAVNYLKCEDKEEIKRKVIVRNLYLSKLPLDIIALQVDLDVPTVQKIIDEITKEWNVHGEEASKTQQTNEDV